MLDIADFFWGVLVALGGAVWVLVLFVRDRRAACAKLSSMLVERIHEMDKVIIEHPEIQKYLSLSATQDENHFRTAEVLQDACFYKAKSFAYWHLNLFDDIISSSAAFKSVPAVLSPQVIELADWENYMRHKIKHPLYRSILNNESRIFGSALRGFWSRNKGAVDAMPVDAHSW